MSRSFLVLATLFSAANTVIEFCLPQTKFGTNLDYFYNSAVLDRLHLRSSATLLRPQ